MASYGMVYVVNGIPAPVRFLVICCGAIETKSRSLWQPHNSVDRILIKSAKSLACNVSLPEPTLERCPGWRFGATEGVVRLLKLRGAKYSPTKGKRKSRVAMPTLEHHHRVDRVAVPPLFGDSRGPGATTGNSWGPFGGYLGLLEGLGFGGISPSASGGFEGARSCFKLPH